MVASLRVSCGRCLAITTAALLAVQSPALAVVFVGDQDPAAEQRSTQQSLPSLTAPKHLGDMRYAPKALLQAGANIPANGFRDSGVVQAGYTQSSRPVMSPQQAQAMQAQMRRNANSRTKDVALRPTANQTSKKPSFISRLFGSKQENSSQQTSSQQSKPQSTTARTPVNSAARGGVQQARYNNGRDQQQAVQQASRQQPTRKATQGRLAQTRGGQSARPGGITNQGSHRPTGLFSFGKKSSQPVQSQVATSSRPKASSKQAGRQVAATQGKRKAAGRLSLLAKQTDSPAKTGQSAASPAVRKSPTPRKLPVGLKLASKPTASTSKPSDGIVFVTDDSHKSQAAAANKKSIINSVSPAATVVINEKAAAAIDKPEGFFVSDQPEPVTKPAALPAAETAKVELAEAPEPKAYPETSDAKLAIKAAPAKSLAVPNPVAPVGNDQPPSERAVSILAEANQFASSAQTEEEFSQLVQRCRHVLAIDRSSAAIQYSNQLASWALNKRGELRADAGSEEEAMVDFQDAVRLNKDCWRAVHNMGVLHAQSGRFAEAFDAFNATIDLNAQFAKAYSNRASLYVQAGEFQAALDDYEEAIAVDPDLAIAHKGRGRVCHMLGRMQGALQHLDAAALLDPNDASTATCRADLLVDMGRYAAAQVGYERAIQLDPQLPNAYRNIAWLQATCPDERFRNAEESVANAQHALELLGEEDDISLDTLAAAQAATGDFDTAIETLERAIELAPSSDDQVYDERLTLYKEGKAFRIAPVEQVQQAGYLQ